MTLPYTLATLPAAAQTILAELQAHGRHVLLLEGGLGAGKTTLVQALCNRLGVAEPVLSPTFGLANTYQSPAGEVHHLDLYRLQGGWPEALEAGLTHYLDSGAWCFIEWPSMLPGLAEELEPGTGVLAEIITLEDARSLTLTWLA